MDLEKINRVLFDNGSSAQMPSTSVVKAFNDQEKLSSFRLLNFSLKKLQNYSLEETSDLDEFLPL